MRTAVILVTVLVLAVPVSAQQTSPPEFRSFGYARLGYGAAFADGTRSAPAIGFGYRGECSHSRPLKAALARGGKVPTKFRRVG